MARGRKHHEEGHQNAERWLLTYADLITLLMVFFIVLYATSQSDVAKFAQVAASLQKAFNVPVLEGQDKASIQGQYGPPVPAESAPAPSIAPPRKAVAPPLSQIELIRSGLYQAIRDDLQEYAAKHNLENKASVELRHEGVLVTISGELLFNAGRADLQPEAQQVLWVAAARLPGLPNEVRVAGHTDNVPLNTAEFPSNWELSSARALTVLHFMRDQMHIDPARLVALGYGQYRPIVSNDTRESRAKNRRVEILIVDQDAQPEETLKP